MQTDDFFRARIDAMINLSDPLAVLVLRVTVRASSTTVRASVGKSTAAAVASPQAC